MIRKERFRRNRTVLPFCAGRNCADRLLQRIFRLVPFGDGIYKVQARPRQLLFGLNGLEHGAHSKLLPLLAEPQALLRGPNCSLRSGNLVGERSYSAVAFDHLPSDFVD